MTAFDWPGFLRAWSAEVLAMPNVAVDLAPEVVATGWLGYPGASEAQLSRVEARLGLRLPPSYRAFLQVSNGWRRPGAFVDRLWSTGEVDWFARRHQDWIDAYVWPLSAVPLLSGAEHGVYGPAQDCVQDRVQ